MILPTFSGNYTEMFQKLSVNPSGENGEHRLAIQRRALRRRCAR